ncbi:uncharacterized protein [Marmota flaviventris]|uniref:uncharacterized protein n=1 Tax=Marmota flaviventris TaxID=93162 RepID=UPI003A896904
MPLSPEWDWNRVPTPRCGAEGRSSLRRCSPCGRTTTQTFFRPLFSSKLGSHGDKAGSLTAPLPNPDLVTVPLTAHPPVHPPLRSRPPRGAGCRPPALYPAQTPSQAFSQKGHRTGADRQGISISERLGPLDKDLTEWEGPAGQPSGSGRRILWDPNPQILAFAPYPPTSPEQAACYPCSLDTREDRQTGARRLPQRLAPTLNPATRSPRPRWPSHGPAPADKAPDTLTEQSPPPDPGPPARSRACPRPGPRRVPRHPGRVLGELSTYCVPDSAAPPVGTQRAGRKARPHMGSKTSIRKVLELTLPPPEFSLLQIHSQDFTTAQRRNMLRLCLGPVPTPQPAEGPLGTTVRIRKNAPSSAQIHFCARPLKIWRRSWDWPSAPTSPLSTQHLGTMISHFQSPYPTRAPNV